jgi:hypothetical protein
VLSCAWREEKKKFGMKTNERREREKKKKKGKKKKKKKGSQLHSHHALP